MDLPAPERGSGRVRLRLAAGTASAARAFIAPRPRRAGTKGLRGTLRADIEAIVMRALEKSPARRYEPVRAMRAELGRWLAHEPVLATTPGSRYRLGKFIRRHRGGVAVGAAMACLMVAAAGVVAWQIVREQHGASRALASKDLPARYVPPVGPEPDQRRRCGRCPVGGREPRSRPTAGGRLGRLKIFVIQSRRSPRDAQPPRGWQRPWRSSSIGCSA
jgi:hypothetical protein